jgi:uncharacterized protein YwgA
MQIIERMKMLEALFAAAGGKVEGRTKLHKLAYLCQVAGDDLGQDFIFHLYGVFSPSLDLDIERGILWGLLKEERGAGNLVITYLCTDPSQSAKKGPGFALVSQLANEPSRVLELLSTIAYLDRVGYSNEELEEKLKELKGHLQKFENQAWRLAEKHFEIKRAMSTPTV